MPIKRKIFDTGSSKGITLPSDWLELIEKETGKEVKEVAMEVNRVLKIIPIDPKTGLPMEVGK